MFDQDSIELVPALVRDPFPYLFNLAIPANASIAIKAQYLKDFCLAISAIEDSTEEVFTRNHWMGITSGFSAAIAIAASSAMVPLAGSVVSCVAIASAIGAIADSYFSKYKIEPVIDHLTRHRIAIESQKSIHWAALWEITSSELFCKAVSYSARGFVSQGKLIQQGKDSPFIRAIDYVAESMGAEYDAVIDAIDLAIAGKQSQLQTPGVSRETRTFPESKARLPIMPSMGTAIADYESPPAPKSQESDEISLPSSVKGFPISDATDVVDTILKAVNSLVFIGGQRCGKSYLMTIASQQGLKSGKFKGVCVISAMSIPGEDDNYWRHCIYQYHCDLSKSIDREREYIRYLKVIAAFQKESSAENPLLLMIDEFSFLAECLTKDVRAKMQTAIDLQDQITGMISALSSGGAKTGRFIWVAMPKGKIGSMGECGKFVKSLSLVFAAIKEGESVNVNRLAVGWDEGIFQDTFRNFPNLRKPEGSERYDLDTRVVFVGNKWYNQTKLSLDPALSVPSRSPSTTASITANPAIANEHSEEEKKTAQAAMVAALRATSYHTLWEFAKREMECESNDEIKELLSAIADLIFDNNLESLKDKFRLSSKYDVRYSYSGYSKKVARAHQISGGKCSCCLSADSENAHHTRYEGADDEPGQSLIAVCKSCHTEYCHSSDNWIKDGVWRSRNTPEWEAKLQAGIELLSTTK